MKISHFCLLSAMLLMSQLAQAQVAVAPQADSAYATRSSIHGSIDSGQGRLDEMDASLALLEKKLSDFIFENRAAAERVIADMREQREAMKQVVDAKRQASEAEWRRLRSRQSDRL